MRNKPRALIVLVVLFAVITCAVLSGGCSNQKPEELTSDGLETTAGTEKTQDTTSGGESSVKTDGTTETKSGPGSDKSTTTKAATESTTAKQTVSGTEMKPFSSTQWKQKEFYLSGFTTGVNRESLTLAKEVGLNLVEFAFAATSGVDEAIKICDEIGLNCLPYDKNRWTAVGKVPLYSETMVYEWMTKVAPHKSVIGYYLFDEILPEQFENFKQYRAVFEKYDPARLCYSILFPSYVHFGWGSASTSPENADYYKYVDSYMKTVKPKVLGFDSYPLTVEKNLDECTYWKDFGVMRAKSIEHRVPFWYYYQASALGSKSACTVPEMKFQMYAGLAYGAKCLSAFNPSGRMYNVGGSGKKPDDFNDIKQNNKEVMTVGRFLFDKTPDKIYHTGLSSDNLNRLYFLDDINNSDLVSSAPAKIIISIFKDNSSKRYMLVANKSPYINKTGTITLKSQKPIGLLNKNSGQVQNLGTSNSISLVLQPGDAALYVIG